MLKGQARKVADRPNHEDARLLIELARWSTESGMAEAIAFLLSEDFSPSFPAFRARHPLGSDGHNRFLAICRYYETVGVLWKHGLLNEALLFDWLAISVVWDRVEEIVAGHREERANPFLWRNFEAAAIAQANEGLEGVEP